MQSTGTLNAAGVSPSSGTQVFARFDGSPQVLVGSAIGKPGDVLMIILASHHELADVMTQYVIDGNDAAIEAGLDRLSANGLDPRDTRLCTGIFEGRPNEQGSIEGQINCEPERVKYYGLLKHDDDAPDHLLATTIDEDAWLAVTIGGSRTEFASFAMQVLHDRLNAGRLVWPLETY